MNTDGTRGPALRCRCARRAPQRGAAPVSTRTRNAHDFGALDAQQRVIRPFVLLPLASLAFFRQPRRGTRAPPKVHGAARRGWQARRREGGQDRHHPPRRRARAAACCPRDRTMRTHVAREPRARQGRRGRDGRGGDSLTRRARGAGTAVTTTRGGPRRGARAWRARGAATAEQTGPSTGVPPRCDPHS